MMQNAPSVKTCAISYESRGVQVPATLVIPGGMDEVPLAVLCHGHGGSREENVGFAAVAAALAARGIASIRMDFPGCGESSESFRLNTLSNMKEDVLAAIECAKGRLCVGKLGLFGYSMGGRIVLELLASGTAADAIVLLAPAADTVDLKELFGGAAAYDAMAAQAEAEGYVVHTTVFGQVQQLSRAWFADLDRVQDPAAEAAAAWNGPALVIWGQDDESVHPFVPEHVAATLGAQTLDATGEGHGYGFYSEDDAVRKRVANATAEFLAEKLK